MEYSQIAREVWSAQPNARTRGPREIFFLLQDLGHYIHLADKQAHNGKETASWEENGRLARVALKQWAMVYCQDRYFAMLGDCIHDFLRKAAYFEQENAQLSGSDGRSQTDYWDGARGYLAKRVLDFFYETSPTP